MAITVGTFLPLSAAATPSPSPSLDHLLLPAPIGYTQVATPTLHGRFSSQDYSANWGTKATEAQKTLEQDGFVDAYGLTWLERPTQHVLVEFVIAFAGGKGAKHWLDYSNAFDLADPTYQHADSVSGIDSPYYGEHNVYPSHDVSDAFAFVKGNDMFVVGYESTQDDVLDLARALAKTHYDSAPSSTIPPAQWPENIKAPSGLAAIPTGNVITAVLIVALIVGVIGVYAALVRRSWEPSAAPAPEAPGWGTVLLSPDGRFWWDGQAWRDSTHEVPPFAQHSDDGLYWWDGLSWRPVPLGRGSRVR